MRYGNRQRKKKPQPQVTLVSWKFLDKSSILDCVTWSEVQISLMVSLSQAECKKWNARNYSCRLNFLPNAAKFSRERARTCWAHYLKFESLHHFPLKMGGVCVKCQLTKGTACSCQSPLVIAANLSLIMLLQLMESFLSGWIRNFCIRIVSMGQNWVNGFLATIMENIWFFRLCLINISRSYKPFWTS